MTTVYLIRHAETEGNLSTAFHGITNSNLSENGEKQLERLSERMSQVSIDIIYSSPLKRAYKTAKAVKGDREIPIIIDPQVQELSGGDWELMKWEDVKAQYPDESDIWSGKLHLAHPPYGESVTQVYQRMVSAIERFVKENNGKIIAVTSHGAALMTYLCYLKNEPLEKILEVGHIANTSMTKVEFFDDGTYRIVFERDISHLDGIPVLHK